MSYKKPITNITRQNHHNIARIGSKKQKTPVSEIIKTKEVELPKRPDFDPAHWGPTTWQTLFTFAFNFPFRNPGKPLKQHYFNFFNSLQAVLPCEKCREGYSAYLQDFPLEKSLHSKMGLIKWLVNLHNVKRPEKTRVNNLDELGEKVLKPDHTINNVLNVLKKRNPNLKFQ